MLRRLFGLWSPVQMMFKEDPSDDPNNPDADGGGDDGGKAGGGGAADDGGGKKESAADTHEIKVNGETRTVTTAELVELAQKAEGAEAKFKEASEIRKKAGDALRQQELITRLGDSDHEPTEAEIRELAGMIGVDPKEFAEYMKGDSEPEAKPDKKGGEGEIKLSKEQVAEVLGIDPAEAKSILEYSRQRHIEDAKKEIRKTSDNAVEKDDVFGKMIVGEDKDDRLLAIKDLVAEDVLRRIQDGEPFGAELVAASVQKIRAYLKRVGIPGKPDQYPVTLGLGPGSGLPADVQSETPIKRVSAAEDGDDSNFVSRWLQSGLKKIRSKG